jgi:hypothetical protein
MMALIIRAKEKNWHSGKKAVIVEGFAAENASFKTEALQTQQRK